MLYDLSSCNAVLLTHSVYAGIGIFFTRPGHGECIRPAVYMGGQSRPQRIRWSSVDRSRQGPERCEYSLYKLKGLIEHEAQSTLGSNDHLPSPLFILVLPILVAYRLFLPSSFILHLPSSSLILFFSPKAYGSCSIQSNVQTVDLWPNHPRHWTPTSAASTLKWKSVYRAPSA